MNIQTPTPETMADLADVYPYPFYEQMRAKGPLVWDDGFKGWLVTSYDLCREIEMKEDLYRHPYADATPELIEIKGGRTVTVLQGAEHARMHRFLLGLFIPRNVDQYRELHVRPIVSNLLERLPKGGRVELTQAFSDQVPPRVIMSLLGMPWDNEEIVRRVLTLHDDVMAWVGMQNRGKALTERARAASHEINAMLLPYIRMRRDQPRDDLISRVWNEGPSELDRIDEADALATCREMFLAGSDTTVHALANALYVLLTQPDLMETIRADRDKALNAFADEILRLYGSVQYRFRVANQDSRFGDVEVGKDQVLVLVNAAANRDPAKFPHPDRIDLDRPRLREHLAFNKGPRTCIGAALARAELVDSIDLLLDRVTNLRLDPQAEPPRFRFHYTRSFRPLNVLFDPVG